jgi:hypothetical protein
MLRYHKEVYFPNNSAQTIGALCDYLNQQEWRYTAHSIDNIKLRVINIEDLLYFIKDLKLDYNKVFEFYADDKQNILKFCYRFNYKKLYDVILVISDNKELITIYINSINDRHDTLKKYLYATS